MQYFRIVCALEKLDDDSSKVSENFKRSFFWEELFCTHFASFPIIQEPKLKIY